MSRRDWLAGLAMQSIIARYGITVSHSRSNRMGH